MNTSCSMNRDDDYTAVDGWNVHSLTMGAGPQALLLHGAGGSTYDMAWRLMPRLAGKATVTAVDRPGHGLTTGTFEDLCLSPLEQAALMWRFCDEKGIANPVIIGQSFGGSVALAMALLRPGRAAGLCILSAPSSDFIPTGRQSVAILERLKTVRKATILTVSSKRFMNMAMVKLFSPEPIPEGYEDDLSESLVFNEARFKHQMLQASGLGYCLNRMMPHYSEIEIPVEILHGTTDPILSYERHGLWLSREIPGSRLTSLEDAGHMPHQTRLEEVAASIFRTLPD
jgi:pimeloyl-ACP methyl ester carboxylesterase